MVYWQSRIRSPWLDGFVVLKSGCCRARTSLDYLGDSPSLVPISIYGWPNIDGRISLGNYVRAVSDDPARAQKPWMLCRTGQRLSHCSMRSLVENTQCLH